MSSAKSTAQQAFEPRIMAFVCNWCTYTGADLAGTSRLQMASNVRVVRLPCTGRIDPLFLTKAFERGAELAVAWGLGEVFAMSLVAPYSALIAA